MFKSNLKRKAERVMDSINPQDFLDKAFNFCLPDDIEIKLSRMEKSKVYDAYTIVYDVTFSPIDEIRATVLLSKVMSKQRVKYDFLEIDLDGVHMGFVFYLNNPPIEAIWIKEAETPALDRLEFCLYVNVK